MAIVLTGGRACPGWTPGILRRSAPHPILRAILERPASRALVERSSRGCDVLATRGPRGSQEGRRLGDALGRRLLGRQRLGATVHGLPEAPADHGADDRRDD